MRIKKIQLKGGFKRFLDLTIDLGDDPKRIIALIGPNGCGKSSVLDGILYYNNQHFIIGNKGAKDNNYYSMKQNIDYDPQNVNIDCDEGSFRDIIIQNTYKENNLVAFRSPYRHNSNVLVKQTTSLIDIKRNHYGASATIDIDDKMEENYRRLLSKYNKYMEDKDLKPSEVKEKIIGDLNKSLENCLNMQIDNLGNIEEDRGTLYFRKNDHPIAFDLNVLSAGEKEVVDILLDIYIRKDEYNNSIYLFDEPELHINTSIQKKLIVEINNLVPPNCQIWFATHSVGFMNALQNELNDISQIIEFQDDIPWASEPKVLEPMIKNRQNWKRIYKTALDDMVELVAPRRLIYCEGKAEPGKNGQENGLDANVYESIFSNKYPETQFVSSGGNTELDQRSDIAIAILSKVFKDIEILVLKDRDITSGKPNFPIDRERYLPNNPRNHRILKRFEIENYLFDKEVLIEYCKVNNLYFKEADYDNCNIDIENDDVKSRTGEIKKFCSIETSISKEQFKLDLAKIIKEDMQVYKELEECIFYKE